ncbi:MAG: hypothetical protein K8W52_43020 [Deltaproteobacteria bacterium]|nr:hypothetical protein [Deltaproteobacteria bacterium]
MSRARPVVATALAVIAVTALVACPRNPAPQPPPSPGGTGWTPPPPPPQPDAAAGAPVGASCSSAADCASNICEGAGCGDANGVCADAHRMCTMDLAAYCGCDGVTCLASGSCPGKRYASRGACAAVTQGPPAKAADGAACAADDDCASGTCEGQGCGDANGVCAPQKRACTKDRRAYCGCDGQTFYGSGSCPGHRFAHKGGC